MPCPFTDPKIVFSGPNFLCQTKIYLDIVPIANFLKRWFVFSKFQIFGPAQIILGLVEGQGINLLQYIAKFYGKMSTKVCNTTKRLKLMEGVDER